MSASPAQKARTTALVNKVMGAYYGADDTLWSEPKVARALGISGAYVHHILADSHSRVVERAKAEWDDAQEGGTDYVGDFIDAELERTREPTLKRLAALPPSVAAVEWERARREQAEQHAPERAAEHAAAGSADVLEALGIRTDLGPDEA